jgi:hypothetical protein
MKLKMIGIVALSVFALSACSQMQPGAQSAKTAATGSAAGEASQNANAGLQHCPAPLGTVAIVEDTEARGTAFSLVNTSSDRRCLS